MNSFLFLGTGGAMGVPRIACHCPVCTSPNPKNKRLRPSGFVTIDNKRFLIDVGPDFRSQALTYHLDQIDGVLLTHSHFDHIAGIDELRVYYVLHKSPLPVLVSRETFGALKIRYDYFFQKKVEGKSLAAQLDFHILEEDRGQTTFLGVPIQYMSYEQGGMKVTGWRFNSFAYLTDIANYPETLFEDLKGVDTLVVSAAHPEPSPLHFSIDQGVAFAKKVGVKKAYFTHCNHRLEHEKTSASLPSGMSLAYDGQILEFA